MKSEIILLHEIDEKKLNSVISEMKKLNSPVIKVVWVECLNCYVALEGTHRISAASQLNIPIIIDAIEYDDISDLDVTSLDWSDIDMDGVTFGEIIGDASERYCNGLKKECEIID